MSLSARGFLHTNNKISNQKFLDIANEIINIINEAIDIEEIDDIDLD
ncbi:hypothetical protein BCD91_001797 [Clostridium beijerinckii]|nr:hypothetical protein [Clostridium beijerinckii]NOW89774.1 hypothetical protein [Clostridium beijerinckii]